MSWSYAPSTGGFYLKDIHGDAIPADAVEISEAQHQQLLAGQAAGQTIILSKGKVVLVAPPSPGLDDLRAAAKAKVRAWAAEFGARFTAGYTAEEIASWGTKAAAARLHLDGQPQGIITAEAALTGENPDDLARTILATAERYQAIVARITGLRRVTMAAIDAAETPEAVEAAVKAALQRALELAGELGL